MISSVWPRNYVKLRETNMCTYSVLFLHFKMYLSAYLSHLVLVSDNQASFTISHILDKDNMNKCKIQFKMMILFIKHKKVVANNSCSNLPGLM